MNAERTEAPEGVQALMAEEASEAQETYCGTVAIVGRPNVGKSTLMNALLGETLSVATPKANTTRERIRGILSEAQTQIIFIDTPGLNHAPKRALGRYMNEEARGALEGVDVALWVLKRRMHGPDDEALLQALKDFDGPVIIALNQSDGHTHAELIEHAKALQEAFAEDSPRATLQAILPISALKGHNLPKLLELLRACMPKGPWLYEGDQLSDRGERFFAEEWIRSALIWRLGEELPHRTAVSVEKIERKPHAKGPITHIDAYIYCERDSQKAIILGAKGGQEIKKIATQARLSLERFLGEKVMLNLWVKVLSDWSDTPSRLKDLGYHNTP